MKNCLELRSTGQTKKIAAREGPSGKSYREASRLGDKAEALSWVETRRDAAMQHLRDHNYTHVILSTTPVLEAVICKNRIAETGRCPLKMMAILD